MNTMIEAIPLGIADIDRVHDEFLFLHQLLVSADSVEFAGLFTQMLKHSRRHFAGEEDMMRRSAYPALAEHRADHQRVLGEMGRFAGRVNAGQTRFARAWVREQLPDWFRTHLHNMDSSLAGHLKKMGAAG